MTYVKINNILYPARIMGKINDSSWGGRSTKTIRLEMTYEEAIQIFVDDISWSIVEDFPEEEEIIIEEYDNSEYNLVGNITDHRDGTISIVMGKITDKELLEIIMGGNYDN